MKGPTVAQHFEIEYVDFFEQVVEGPDTGELPAMIRRRIEAAFLAGGVCGVSVATEYVKHNPKSPPELVMEVVRNEILDAMLAVARKYQE